MAGITTEQYDSLRNKASRQAKKALRDAHREEYDSYAAAMPLPKNWDSLSKSARHSRRIEHAARELRKVPANDSEYVAEYERLKKQYLQEAGWVNGHLSPEYIQRNRELLAQYQPLGAAARWGSGKSKVNNEERVVEQPHVWTPGGTVKSRSESVLDRHGIIGRKRPGTILSQGAFQD